MYLILRIIPVVFLAMSFSVTAQFRYKITSNIPVQERGRELSMPWVGGLNAVQINTMDLNGDERQDLVVFDRSVNKIVTFLNQRDHYEYNPEYAFLFPDQVRHWLLLRDVDCDGKKDLFTSDSFGLVAFLNNTREGGELSWRPFNDGRPLLTKGAASTINIKINESDIPAIDDIDGDGDLDILHVKFTAPPTVEWNKNLSMEREQNCDSMQFERVLTPRAWGGVEECACGQFSFLGQPCVKRMSSTISMILHTGGKALLTFDADNDGDKELVMSEENCSQAFLLTNRGTPAKASITTSDPFPRSKPIFINSFPASFLEDVTFDGLPDLIASPNIYARTIDGNVSFHKSVWLYKNTGTILQPQFTFVKNNFLQDNMIDVGDEAYPAFTDYDGDGDQDMFIGHHSHDDRGGSIFYYENIGTRHEPSFRLITDNFMNLSAQNVVAVKPQFADINNDGNTDLVVVSTLVNPDAHSSLTTTLAFLSGKNFSRIDLHDQFIPLTDISLDYGENTLVVDVDLDGDKDILISRLSGALEYWENEGSLAYTLKNPAFMGLESGTIRARSMTVMDLDGDKQEDLALGDRLGHISIYENFRKQIASSSTAITDIIYDPFKKLYTKKNLGGQITPVAVNLFDSDLPVLAVGTLAGGILMLEPDNVKINSVSLQTKLYPNPVLYSDPLFIVSTRDAFVEIFATTGQKMLLSPIFITANKAYSITSIPFAKGVYIAKFISMGISQSHLFVVY